MASEICANIRNQKPNPCVRFYPGMNGEGPAIRSGGGNGSRSPRRAGRRRH